MNENSEIQNSISDCITWAESTCNISELKPYERNPRKISAADYERLKQSVQRLGQFAPLIVTHDFKLASGHQRLKIFKELGWERVRVTFPDRALSEAEFREVLIRANVNNGAYDFDLLNQDFSEFELEEWGAKEPKRTVTFKTEVNEAAGFIILAEFATEAEQQKFYNELKERKIICKILT